MQEYEEENESIGTNLENRESKTNIPTPTNNPPNNTFFIQSAPNPPFLKTLSAEDVISFTHSYAHQSGNISIQHYIGGKVIRELSDVYDAKTDKAIKEVLEQIVAEYDDEKREMNIRIFRSQLKWPEDKPYRLQVKHFINSIKRLATLKEMKDKIVAKQVLKIAISKLPSRFEIDTDEYNQLHKLVRSAQKKLLDKDQYEHLQKMEENKKPGLELLEQLLKLKQWAMNGQEDDVKIEEVMKVQQPATQHTAYPSLPATYAQPKANGLPPIFLRAANNRNQLPSSTPPRNTKNVPVNNNSLPNFNYHLQQSSQGAMQRYQSPQRNPNRAQNVIARRFEGINGQVLNQEKAQIFIVVPMGSWQSVKGCLDSGATATVGGFQQNSQLCHTVYPMRKERYVVLPNNQKLRVTHTGLIRLKVKYSNGKENEWPRMKIALEPDEYEAEKVGYGENCERNDADEEQRIKEKIRRKMDGLSEDFEAKDITALVDLILDKYKKLYPIWFSFKRIPWLLFGQESTITVFTDHKNLQYVLSPEESPKQSQVGRMSRWSYQFQKIDMVLRHIPGEENVAADILSHWGNRYAEEVVKMDDSQTDVLMFLRDVYVLNVEVDLEDLNEATKNIL
eukprot:augustus_masked-scaffold_49-processed-gene-1.7-mRNA-1 protein AED:1.00 eAED:1.00 QI:0/0/0/0/1/1/4/0/618